MTGNKLFDGLFIFVMSLHLFNCPYTKVEESFNMQAMHDILYHGKNISQYDHLRFPGVVPRTFIGPLLVSALSYPMVKILQCLEISKIYMQLVCRCILGLLVCFAFGKFHSSISKRISPSVGKLCTVLTLCQFHFFFYSSRTLPNTFALILVLFSISCWISNQNRRFIWYSAFAIIIFRSELSIFMGLLLLAKLINGQLTISETVKHCFYAGPLALGATVLIDSFFWQRYLWPEGEVLHFNIVQNKSSNWGTLPFLWYFYSAIPRSLLFATPLVPFGLILKRDSMISKLNIASLFYVLFYSILPHKEFRFIIYVIPVLNMAAAIGILNILRWFRSHRYLYRLVMILIAALVGATIIPTCVFAYVSSLNYPGGNGFSFLHSLNNNMKNDRLSVHICNAAAQTGVTRFGELYENWSYSKDEDFVFSMQNEYRSPYSLLLIEGSCPRPSRYEVQAAIDGFHGWKLHKTFPYIDVITKTKLCILKLRGLR